MRQAFEQVAASYQTKVDFEDEIMYPNYQISEDEKVVQLAIQACSRIGRKPRLLSSGGGSDANHFNGYHIPTANLGIGYEYIHTTREQIALKELIKTAEVVLAIIQEAAEI